MHHSEEALKAFMQELAIRRDLKDLSPQVYLAHAMLHVGTLQREAGNHTEALPFLQEAMTLYERSEGKGVNYAHAAFEDGLALVEMRRKQEAQDSFIDALLLYRAAGYEDTHPKLEQALQYARRSGGKRCGCPRKCKDFPCKTLYSVKFNC
eukprot:CAMPEP_0118706670 /NCGR_PEP_ID=MMETSP0800-20121206/20697_1 /TAXON_ID=210618 ORGANISM="Striatella unipunctata, Strain CCMP2910" /NCGR_SAMPLE_ID=MMETSP0800 /ASSEMBLY_ACC=CAM_ASM_000638 /LENGTH=150 /DNA_ID=CAMNT_0006609251 /DNA_START=139 /DNA_END=591 /DNA_ORIENTATION=-